TFGLQRAGNVFDEGQLLIRGVGGNREIRPRRSVLNPDEARALLDSIETDTLIGLRDRALIGLMVFTFARVGATVTMKVEDCYLQGRRLWIRLHEKGGKRHEVPANHSLDDYLAQYLEAADLENAPKL